MWIKGWWLFSFQNGRKASMEVNLEPQCKLLIQINYDDAIILSRTLEPDTVLLDLSMPG